MRGFACHPCCHGRGALLPHLFTLTLRLAPASRRALARGRPSISAPLRACLERALEASRARVERRYVFCATFLQVALTGRYPAHCPAEFGLSSSASATCEGGNDHLARCDGIDSTSGRTGGMGRTDPALPAAVIRQFPA